MSFLKLPRRMRGAALAATIAATGLTFTNAYAANLVNGGGPVQSAPKIFLVWWGQQWATGWTDAVVAPDLTVHTYTSHQAQTYITDFVQAGLGYGSVTQYGAGIPSYGGSWVDTNPLDTPPPVVPDNCVAIVCVVPGGTIDIANLMAQEAIRAEAHFGANSLNNNFVIMLPKATITIGTGYYCAYHSEAVDGAGHKLSWTNMPYLPDVNVTQTIPLVGCGINFVNGTDNAYGNGFYDGYSMVLGHEIAETATDPYPFTASAWRDPSGQENGDLCAWQPSAHNVGAFPNGKYWAVQAYWSNSAGACA